MGAVSVESIQIRAAALTAAVEFGAGYLPTDGVDRAQAAIAKTAARVSIAGGRTVVALAGATGGGKSSLFNMLVGADVAQVGARRPTTSKPTAAVWGSESPAALLDWLMVEARHMVDEGLPSAVSWGSGAADQPATVSPRLTGAKLDGLVLLDLPDFDSKATEHRIEADRVLDLVDVFVWVTDPQKYADSRLHEDYIAKLSAHDAVTITVLNQADRLTVGALAACHGDLLRLLGSDGVVDPEVITTSARDGSGVGDLCHRISEVVAGHRAAVQRLDSDLRSAATLLRSSVADAEPNLDDFADMTLVGALSRAAGIPVILDAVERDYRRATGVLTGWPVTRFAVALRPTLLKLFGLNKDVLGRPDAISVSDVRSVLGRSSLPPVTPVARAAVVLATRELAGRSGRGMPQVWADAIADAAMPPGEDLGDALDQAVVGAPLRARDPIWWTVFWALQWIVAVAVGVGLVWFVALTVLGWLRPRSVQAPVLGLLSYPILLFAAGLVVGLVMSLFTGALGRVGGKRRRRLVGARLHASVAQVVRDRLVGPVQEILDRHRMTRESLDAARKPL